jgi:mercuric ion transport protein
MKETTTASITLFGGVLSAIGAAICCLGPLALVAVGISGAWISNLSALEAYRPIFIAVAIVFTALAYRQIFVTARPPEACEPGSLCAVPATNRIYKTIFWVVAALVVVALAFPYFMPLFY